MSKELLLVAEALSNEKGVSKEVVQNIIESAIASAICKVLNQEIGVRVKLDPRTGDYDTLRYWDVIADEEEKIFPEMQLSLSEAQTRSPELEVGDRLEEPMAFMESKEFGRIAAQAARHLMSNMLREAERELVREQFQNKLGQLVYGTVKKVTRDNIIIDLGWKAEAFMPRTETLPNEMFRPNDRVRAYLYEIKAQSRGPQLFVSRARTEMLVELFRIEVPEIGENTIEIKAAARDIGNRSKIAVKTKDGRIDPIGACVGMRGARVQAVSSELGGERVDIILWDDNPAQLVINAMAPAEITSIVVDEESHTMDLAVVPEQLSQAIGRSGQNVRLASQLTGWVLNVMTIEDFEKKGQEESSKAAKSFVETLQIDDALANLLVEQGFSTIEEIAYVPEEELLAVEGLDEATVKHLQNKANDALLTKALTMDQSVSDGLAELRALEGMDEALLISLKKLEVMNVEDLAGLSVDELLDIDGMTKERAAALIMKAREPWFK